MWFIGLDYSSIVDVMNNITYMCIIAIVIIAIVLSFLGVLFSRLLISPLKQSVAFATKVSEGSLNEKLLVKTNDEIGELAQALRTMVDALTLKISEAEEATKEANATSRLAEEQTKRAEEAAKHAEYARRDGMLTAANKLEGMAAAISAAATELTSQIKESDHIARTSSERLSEAAVAMNEMNVTVQEVAQNASQASAMSKETRKNAEDGQKILSKAMESIENVHAVSIKLKEEMGMLSEHTQNISHVMNVISDIADQTNLLALNAAIEAARAGDAGRGFAVVADEVRKLAEKTMDSTQNVSKAITEIQGSAQQSVNRMEEALKNVEQSTARARESGEALHRIVKNVEGTAD